MKHCFVCVAFFICAIFFQNGRATYPAFSDLFYQRAAGLFVERYQQIMQQHKISFIALFELIEQCFSNWKDSASKEKREEVVFDLPTEEVTVLFVAWIINVSKFFMDYDDACLKNICEDFWYFLYSIFRLAVNHMLGISRNVPEIDPHVAEWTGELFKNISSLANKFTFCISEERRVMGFSRIYYSEERYRNALFLETSKIVAMCKAKVDQIGIEKVNLDET